MSLPSPRCDDEPSMAKNRMEDLKEDLLLVHCMCIRRRCAVEESLSDKWIPEM